MPELPEVEHGRRLAEAMVLGQRIVDVVSADDPIVFDGLRPDDMAKALCERTIKEVRRHGKYIWFVLDRPPFPVFHFGMTGAFRTQDALPLRLSSSPKKSDPSWPPRYTKIQIRVEGGEELVMTSARRLGRIRLRRCPESEPPISRLGFDPYLAPPSPEDFRAAVSQRSRSLKGLLLDQSFAAGVGNWIADEVLYQARLHPGRAANTLRVAESDRLLAKLRYVIDTAVAVNAEKDQFPKAWLYHRRWKKQKHAKTVNGEAIEHSVVAGRTTAWVPGRQR